MVKTLVVYSYCLCFLGSAVVDDVVEVPFFLSTKPLKFNMFSVVPATRYWDEIPACIPMAEAALSACVCPPGSAPYALPGNL